MANKIQVSRILHAGYIIECAGVRIAFDPIFESPFSRNCYAFPKVRFDDETVREQKFDAVFISHYHDDHCSFESLDLVDRATPIFMYCIFDEMFGLLRELGFQNVHPVRLDAPIELFPFAITARRALDDNVDSIFHIECEGLKILNVVDSWIGPETLELLTKSAPWDLILWPFQTMREIEVLAPRQPPVDTVNPETEPELPHEWLEQLAALRPRYVIASSCQFKFESWSWYNTAFFPISYARFAREVEQDVKSTKVLRLDPGESVYVDHEGVSTAPSLPWIERVDDKSVDYIFNVASVPQSTFEIAKRLGPVTADQRDRVTAFLHGEIFAKHNALEPSDEAYWQKARKWRLVMFDHDGCAQRFNFYIKSGELKSHDGEDTPDWETEIPLIKLYAALEDGESLTSMYMRIKNAPSDKDAPDVDIISDPLLRILFQRQFGCYQKAQLKRLQKRERNLALPTA